MPTAIKFLLTVWHVSYVSTDHHIVYEFECCINKGHIIIPIVIRINSISCIDFYFYKTCSNIFYRPLGIFKSLLHVGIPLTATFFNSGDTPVFIQCLITLTILGERYKL
jgi:hypothetical protein